MQPSHLQQQQSLPIDLAFPVQRTCTNPCIGGINSIQMQFKSKDFKSKNFSSKVFFWNFNGCQCNASKGSTPKMPKCWRQVLKMSGDKERTDRTALSHCFPPPGRVVGSSGYFDQWGTKKCSSSNELERRRESVTLCPIIFNMRGLMVQDLTEPFLCRAR